MHSEIVCLTTFRQGSTDNPVEKIRAEVFLDTAKEMKEFGIPLVVLFTETRDDILISLERLRVTLVEQRSAGMGSIRREAMQTACSLFPNAKWYCWMEPEKPNLVRFIPLMTTQMLQEQSVLGLFNRIGMTSYPAEESYFYLFCRVVASKLLGFDVDYAFGPMMISRSAIRYFLEYDGEYGDKWEAILVPRLRIINQGMGVTLLPIDFENDPRMTAVESGNTNIILKRVEQINNIVPSMINEWEKLRTV